MPPKCNPKLGISRAMAREVLQILHQKRLVALQPRVGASVLPVEQWDVFDPDVVEWRLVERR
jgi:DNA-binding FadR family transcriptional regulator